jgi:hypothetical protein
MQNANYFGMMKCKIPNFLWVCLVPSTQIFHGVGESLLAFWLFFYLLRPKSKMDQKFCMMFSFILQNDGPKPKTFWVKWETKHTLSFILSKAFLIFTIFFIKIY